MMRLGLEHAELEARTYAILHRISVGSEDGVAAFPRTNLQYFQRLADSIFMNFQTVRVRCR